MKKFIPLISIIAAGAVAVVSPSCRKVETEPKDWFTERLTFDTLDQNAIIAGYNLNNIYTYIPNGFDRIDGEFLDDAAGDAVPSRYNTSVENFLKGTITLINNPDQYWSNSYYGIRRSNIFLKNIDKVPLDKTSTGPTTKKYWKAEARFLRAFFYWELVKRYGGVPLLGDTVLNESDNLMLPRNTFAQCVDYIVAECDAVKNDLRVEPVADADWGRVPKGAAIALKCRVLLYAASPLFNGGGIESDATRKALTGYTTEDASRWLKVIAAAEELNALNYYKLVTSGTPTAFTSVFTTKKSTEIILAKQVANHSNLEYGQGPVGYIVSNTKNQGFTSPTQNLVDAFPMVNGKAINEAGSGYDAANPYTNRDPRLAATVFYNGVTWLNRAVDVSDGGTDKPDNFSISPLQTRTGYYLRKFLGNFTTASTYSSQSHNFPIFRYAEVILSYAEALNEANRTEDAVTQIKLLRSRAGIAAGSDSRYGIAAAIAKDAMRTLIRNERRIELAFEEHRFWDIRRWKTAATELTTPLRGVRVTKNGTGVNYQLFNVMTPVFPQRYYHMPIPYDEANKNTALIQNEGW